MCLPAEIDKAATPRGRDARLLMRNQRRIRTKANPLATGLDRWLRATRDLWMDDVTAALQGGGLARLEQLVDRDAPVPSKPERRSRIIQVGKAMTATDVAGLEATLQRMLRKFGLKQMDTAGRSTARATGGDWVLKPELAAEWNDKLANKVVLLVDDTRTQIRNDIKRIVSDALRESPRPTAKALARRIARQWYGPAGKTPKGWPGRGTEEERRVTADWARDQPALDAGGKEYLFSFDRAATIARTELHQAENAAIAESYGQSDIKLVGWLAFPYNASHDRPPKRGGFPPRSHYLMNGHKPIAVEAMQSSDEDRWFKLPPLKGVVYRAPYPGHIGLPAGHLVNCFLPDTRVAGSFVGGLRARYSGDAIHIKTRSGRVLSVTPNHPLLTGEGYRAASTLRNGDDLVCYGTDIESDPGPDTEHRPTAIAEVFCSLSEFGKSHRRVDAVDLHGDAAACDGDVEIVDINRPLLFDDEAGSSKSFGDLGLVPPDPELAGPHGAGALSFFGIGMDSSAGGIIGGLNLSPPGGRPSLGPGASLRIGSAANLDTGGYQPASYDGPGGIEPASDLLPGDPVGVHRDNGVGADFVAGPVPNRDTSRDKPAVEGPGGGIELAAQLRLRYPAHVKLDQVVAVDVGSFVGHVYDLQSDPGWIVANGLFSSNCQCSSVPRRG